MTRRPIDRRCHLVARPGDRRVICGRRVESDTSTVWTPFVGAHEASRQFSGAPPVDWCNDCLLGLTH